MKLGVHIIALGLSSMTKAVTLSMLWIFLATLTLHPQMTPHHHSTHLSPWEIYQKITIRNVEYILMPFINIQKRKLMKLLAHRSL